MLPVSTLVVLAVLAAAAPASVAARVQIERVDAVTHADAAAGLQAWVGSKGELRLRTRTGPVSTAPVRGGIAPQHLDVGTDAADRPLVAYARCNATGLRCNLFTYSPSRRLETRLPAAINSAAEEGYPSVLGGRIAFVRWSSRRPLHPGKPRVYVSLLKGLPVRESLGPGGVIGITWTELSAHGLFVGALYPADFRDQRMLRLVDGKVARIDRAISGGASAAHMTKPTVGSRQVYYARTNRGSGQGNRFFRIDLRTGVREESQGSGKTQSASFLGATFLVSSLGYDGTIEFCDIVETDRITWRPAKPPKRD